MRCSRWAGRWRGSSERRFVENRRSVAGREGTAHSRRLTRLSYAAKNQAHCDLGTPDRIADAVGCSHRASAMGNPLGRAAARPHAARDGAVWCAGREGTAHFRRLTPPSFAAQNPLQGGLRLHDRSADAVGCSHRASAMGNPLGRRRRGRALRAGWGRLVRGPRGDRSLSAADAAFVRGKESGPLRPGNAR
jgi:hypothetical protein